jgi:TonB family protein
MTQLMHHLAQVPAHPLVHALGWTLLHFCWQGLLVAALLWCVLALLDGQSSLTRYGASCLALGLLIALPAATFAHIASAEYAQRADAWNTAIVLDPGIMLQVGVDAPAEPWPARLAVALDRCLPWILAAWFTGLLVFIGRLNFGLLVARRLKHADTQTPPSGLLQAFDTLRVRLGIARAVRLMHSARVQVPTVIGWLRPVVLIPASCLTGLSTEQIEAIFCHELAHVRRHDYLVSVFQSVVETVLFYHPAVWWVSKQVRRERECCCDAVAVGIGGDVLAYARALSFLEESRAGFPEFVLGANGGALKMRIKRLLGRPENSAASQLASIALLALLIIGAGATAARRLHAQATAAQPAANSSATIADGIVQQTLNQVETDAQQRTHDALAAEIEQLQRQLSAIDAARPKFQQQITAARLKAEEANRELQALQARQLFEELQRRQNGEAVSQDSELSRQFEEAQRKAQATLHADDQLRKQFADAQASLAKLHNDQLGKHLDEMLKNQDSAAQRQQLEGLLNSPEFRKHFQDAQAAAARLNSPEYRKQLDDAIKAAGNLNTANLKQQLDDLLAENKVLTQALPGAHLYAAPPAPSAPNAVTIPPGTMQGNLIHKVNPVYPEIAKQAHVQGIVVLHALISKAGTVEDLKVVSGSPMLISSAIDAVKQWRYKPYLVDGAPTEVETTINVNYSFAPPDMSCTYYKSGTAHAGTCEEGTAGKGRYYCRADDDKTLVQSQIGCESKVKRQQDSQHDSASPTAIQLNPLPAGPNIRSIEYKGLNSVTFTEVAARFQRDNIGLRLETPYDPVRINRAAASLKTLLAEHGRLNPIIRLQTHSIPPNAIGILFNVTEGQKSTKGTKATTTSPRQPQVAAYNPAEKLQRIGGDVSSPLLIYKVDPEFTQEARKAKASGIVLVNFVVDRSGLPQNVHVIRGIGNGLDAKAVEAVSQYKFKPAMRAGKPVPVALNVEVNFQVF